MPRVQRERPARAVANNAAPRHRATPSRLVKLYKHLAVDQRKAIEDVKFGGLLKIACSQIPSDFANWIMVQCFDHETSQLILPGRGRISLTAGAVAEKFGLPNRGDPVKYELDVDAINFIHEKYGIVRGTAPKIETIVQRVKANKEADEDFLRSWLMLAVSTFLCQSTGLGISPRCYPSIIDLSSVKKLNWAQFVVDQLKDATSKFDKKNSLKPSANTTVQNSLFTVDDVHQFVSSKALRGMADQNKRKLCDAVGKVLSGVTELLSTFVQKVGSMEFSTQDAAGPSQRRSKRNRTTPPFPNHDIPDDEELDSDYEEELEDEEEEEDNGEEEPGEEEEDFGEEEETYNSDDDAQVPPDEDDSEMEDVHDAGDGLPSQGGPMSGNEERERRSKMVFDDRSGLHPIAEGNEEVDKDEQGTLPGRVHEQAPASNIHQEEADDEDDVPLIIRLRKIKETANQGSKEQQPEFDLDVVLLEVVPPQPAKICTLEDRNGRLRLLDKSSCWLSCCWSSRTSCCTGPAGLQGPAAVLGLVLLVLVGLQLFLTEGQWGCSIYLLQHHFVDYF
nr:uncharacterized protein LOC117838837 isoform X2 [Setaria viridis]